jgi:hypothetical protein
LLLSFAHSVGKDRVINNSKPMSQLYFIDGTFVEAAELLRRQNEKLEDKEQKVEVQKTKKKKDTKKTKPRKKDTKKTKKK